MFGNWLKTAILMAGIVALFGVVGGAIGGQSGLLLGLLFAGATNFFAYWNSDKLVLRRYDAQALASALQKMQNYSKQIPNQTAEQHPETAQMMIINPLSGGGIASLFSAHPQTEERAARLLQMARGA